MITVLIIACAIPEYSSHAIISYNGNLARGGTIHWFLINHPATVIVFCNNYSFYHNSTVQIKSKLKHRIAKMSSDFLIYMESVHMYHKLSANVDNHSSRDNREKPNYTYKFLGDQLTSGTLSTNPLICSLWSDVYTSRNIKLPSHYYNIIVTILIQ